MRLKNLVYLFTAICILAVVPSFAGNGEKEKTATVQALVVDESGEPLAGVAVRIQGYAGVVYTNLDGQFEIPVPKTGKLNISLSTISYQEKQISLDSKNNSNSGSLTISLEPQKAF
ncbi:MAG: hypothetical protein GC180_04125 [Bacteroidetes bacterium]|nr:hypothetical protein [Bacteroidota bacterium]